MKLFALNIFFLLGSTCLFAQISDEDMAVLTAKWRAEITERAIEKSSKMVRVAGKTAFSDSMSRVFYMDTMIVDYILKKQQMKDPTNLGINKANMAAAKAYEELVAQYAGILEAKLEEKDAQLFLDAHQQWKKFIEEERVLCGRLMQKEYSGGGPVHSLKYTDRLMRQYRNRAIELADYLSNLNL